MDYNTNNNSSNMNYHKLIPVSIEEARNWYKGDDNILKTLALRAFSEKELGHSFRDIKSFEDACNALGLDYDDLDSVIANMIIFGHSRASAAMFKLNIIRKALNFGKDLHLIKGSFLYHPCNPFISKLSPYYKSDDSVEIIGEVKCEGIKYKVINSVPHKCDNAGLANYSSFYYTANTTAATCFLGCATKEIAEHFGRYFGMLITEAKYGDVQGFEIVNSKYKN